MNSELEAIREAWDPGDIDHPGGENRDEERTRNLADKYVKAHPEQFEKLQEKSHDELVRAIDVYRAAGMDDDEWLVQAWLFHKFEPQNIGGIAEVTVRMPR